MNYRVCLVDPPWKFNKRNKGTKFGQGAAYEGGSCSVADLAAFWPLVDQLTTKDCYFFVWVCESKPKETEEFFRAWNLEQKTTAFVWVKTYLGGGVFRGPGNYTASNIERCILARKKKAGPMWHDNKAWMPPQVLLEPHERSGGKIIHSRKPQVFHTWLNRWLGEDTKKLELFATQHTQGWDCIGHALSGNDLMVDLEKMLL